MSRLQPIVLSSFFVRSLLIMVAAAACGCGNSAHTQAVALDKQIEEKWMANRKVIDAVQFLEGGGHYENLGDDDEVPIDTPFVLPLIKRFRDEFSLSPVAVLDDPQSAMAILVELPSDPAVRKRIGEVLQQADDAFPGLLLDNWGKKWLSLDFLDEKEAAALKGSGSLDLIQKEVESRRRTGN
jgi:hypothetical protein